MNLAAVIILAALEGITEFLPVSSTGHLILAGKLLGLPQTDLTTSFELFIQLGAVMAIIALYGKTLITKKDVLPNVCLAFIPTAIGGIIFYPFIKHGLLGNSDVVIASLGIGGLALLLVEYGLKKRPVQPRPLTRTGAVIIGVVQILSFIPGVSRAAATIIGGMLVGLSRSQATEFSFLMAVPTIIAAVGLDLIKTNAIIRPSEYGLLIIGGIVAFIAARLTVTRFLAFISHHTFVPFALYRIGVALTFFFL